MQSDKLRYSPRAQALTEEFYEWEVLGRGWLCADQPIELEPPFTPFFGHGKKRIEKPDDGIRHNLISAIAAYFSRKRNTESPANITEVSYTPFVYTDDELKYVLKLQLTKHSSISAPEIEQFLSMLAFCEQPLSFEIIATASRINFQIVCRGSDLKYVKSQLATYLKPVGVVSELMSEPELVDLELPVMTVDFGLKEEFMRPLSTLRTAPHDPLRALCSVLDHLEDGERLVYQVLFSRTLNHWQGSIIKAVSDDTGGHFFENAPDMLSLAKEKVSAPFFACTVRLIAQAYSVAEASELIQKTTFALIQGTKSQGNALAPLPTPSYTIEQRLMDIGFRESHRFGMLINIKELSALVHIPGVEVLSKKMFGQSRTTKPLPSLAVGHEFKLGVNWHQGKEVTASVSTSHRLQHTHIIGATGTGKSTLLHSMICQDIEAGNGVAVLDPHGDLIDAVIQCVPKDRVQDVILIDPADSEYPIGLNILKAHSDSEKELLASDLVAAFRRQSTSWGDQMNAVFANAILAFLENTSEGTLLDLRRFLVEPAFRKTFLQTVSDPNVTYYWLKEYPLLKTNSVGPILTRLDSFLRPKLIRHMVAQRKGIDFEEVLNRQKILLVKLAQGLIGEENSYLLGSFIVTKLHQAALARQKFKDRSDFFFYVDEFQHFATPSLAQMLSGVRKYHVGLILAHQELQQIQKQDSSLLHSLLSNTATRISFRIGEGDAKSIAGGFKSFGIDDFLNLGTGEAIARIERPEFDFSLSTVPYEKTDIPYGTTDAIIAHSRNEYCRPVSSVIEGIEHTLGFHTSEPETITKNQEARMSKTQSQEVPQQKQTLAIESKPIAKPLPISQTKKEVSQHTYLQTLIKNVAESKGYKAVSEHLTQDGRGRIDVSIEGHGHTIACEISVTTGIAWEIHNIEKCINAGYTIIFVCCTDIKSAEAINARVAESQLRTKEISIAVGTAESLFELLDSFAVQPSQSQEVVKGYRIKVEYDALSAEDMKKKKDSVARVISEAMKRMKK